MRWVCLFRVPSVSGVRRAYYQVPTQIVAPVELLYRNITCSVRSRSLVAKETAQEMFGILTKQWEAMHPEATNVFSRPRALHITESAERAKTGFKFKFFVCVPSERAFECAEKLNSAAAAKGLSHFRPGGWTVGKAEELDAEYWLARREELVAQEMERPVNVAYIDQHPELSWSHRTNVIIFILDMVFNEEWSIATQHAAIRIFDFFMSRASNVPRNRLEHIAMASATLAAKLHDVEIINLSHLSDAYLGNDEANIPTKIAELEQLALGAAVWDPNISLNMTTPYSYFEFLCSEEDAGFEQLVSLLCHCAILHNETLLLTMADLVSGAIVIAKKLLQFEDPWDQRDIKMMGLSARAAAENANFVTSAVSSVKDDLSSNKHVFRTNPNFEFIEQLLRE
ncbi:hypothetical protein M427DRAFT_351295 [Gonapodya prolifera JEL478]|uniref:Cyclin N-terminal domain-containing protein n=1 Tax=Gonapodya prolifera (strain JEL478) TaxID=1344416 RepID=A0A139AWH3_GONPJ|nr:hypothetical protein M427DRAFT_351295 [Gonapodya prolifera JEL478]|eukprot:KXS21057.1 hypothetical protein M427DRAFT_351295 [Gonapodya prolifera JEL478]